MNFKRYAFTKHGLQVFDMVPLLDVIVLLVFFYMLTSALTLSPKIDVALPKAVVSADVEQRNLVVTISGENVIYLHGQIVSSKDLKEQLSKFAPQNFPVLIKADRRASVGRIVDVWDLCRVVGIERINIATDSQQ